MAYEIAILKVPASIVTLQQFAELNDKWFSGSSTGKVFRAVPSYEHNARKILSRVARLASAAKLST
ncbi:hypothetical protein ACXG8N_002638 [Klebsiella aerogenes]|uniref:hypothetical protein n=1 Tax=Klebsiella aerogenes TaxID=548 RepID=UPI0012DC83D2|nr:hypothetical protein [Klebsiella aerogenes]EJC6254056.1 hypothetical protein [Klebsiella aerogenes]ELA1893767.1 hypothetical protein [Klebsiella aerogenes]MCB4371622.1 hypothetical protein [Klebsiella aerogenes]MEB5739810.1 hypothetical protein [Klebsiella aerogenes]HBT4313951.1 hypothetical protein [Klebsiella aerogenes]